MATKRVEGGTRRTFVAVMVVLTAIMLALPAAAFALPSERPDNTPGIDGRVRAIEQVGNKIWLGGTFNKVKGRNGTVVDNNAGNLAVFDAQSNQYLRIAPNLGGAGSEVWDIRRYGGTGPRANAVLIAGKFSGPSSDRKNLVLVDAATGKVLRWYNAESLKTVLPAPNLAAPGGGGRVYAGGRSLTAFDFTNANKLWTKAKTGVDRGIRGRDTAPAYRDLLLDGQKIWAACICDSVNGERSKSLVKLGTDGRHFTSWVTEAGKGSFGQDILQYNNKLYLGAGGSDFVAQYGKSNDGKRGWVRDTSGSTQALTAMDGKLIVGGHFYYVGDKGGDRCGKGRPGDPKLNPRGECKKRQGIAAYSFSGALDTKWNPSYAGSYSLVWALNVERTRDRLHTGGEFKTVSGITQDSYARFS